MDFLTHSLVGAGIGRIAAPNRASIPAYALAGMLGGLLPDSDSWLALLGPNVYGLYHRVITHSIAGLIVCGCSAGYIAWQIGMSARLQRFGWFVSPHLTHEEAIHIQLQPFPLVAVGCVGAALHWCMDWITGFGNLKPFWPWRENEYHLGAVVSFDLFIFMLTLAWHVAVRRLSFRRRTEFYLALIYFAVITAYIFLRWKFGHPTVW